MTLIELLILDVDGVLTDGRLAFGSVGEPQKSFFTRDGHAIKTWQRSGGRIALLSGRREQAITNRAAELGIDGAKQILLDETGRNFESFLHARPEGRPFCYWWGPTNTHRFWHPQRLRFSWSVYRYTNTHSPRR